MERNWDGRVLDARGRRIEAYSAIVSEACAALECVLQAIQKNMGMLEIEGDNNQVVMALQGD